MKYETKFYFTTYHLFIINSQYVHVRELLAPYRALAGLAVTDPAVRAEFPVAGPDGAPVGLSGGQTSPPSVALLAEGLAGRVDRVQRNYVPERADVGIADQR